MFLDSPTDGGKFSIGSVQAIKYRGGGWICGWRGMGFSLGFVFFLLHAPIGWPGWSLRLFEPFFFQFCPNFRTFIANFNVDRFLKMPSKHCWLRTTVLNSAKTSLNSIPNKKMVFKYFCFAITSIFKLTHQI